MRKVFLYVMELDFLKIWDLKLLFLMYLHIGFLILLISYIKFNNSSFNHFLVNFLSFLLFITTLI